MAGCFLFVRTGGPRGPLSVAFPHGIHARNDLGCADCHLSVEKGEKAGLPAREVCLDCHDEGEEPFEKEMAELPTLDWKPFAVFPDLRFSHGAHLGRGLPCDTCHGEVGTSPRVTAAFAPREETCSECHKKEGVDEACETCHLETRRDRPPPTHTRGWTRGHGITLREGGIIHHQGKCDRCHGEDSCSRCHREEPPRDHSQTWRVRTHGIGAEIDRERCMACHTEDACVRCHLSGDVLPLSHRRGGWESPTHRHCTSCHEPLEADSCGVCHDATPRHGMVPLPPGHVPASNCRACHIGLRHRDDGSPCLRCHN